MTRVVLLNSPVAGYSSMPLLNLACLSAVLKKAGHKVMVIDAAAPYKRLSEKEVFDKIRAFKPNFVGITLTITFIPKAYEFISKLKKLGFPIVAGGPHANCLPYNPKCNGKAENIVKKVKQFLNKYEVQSIEHANQLLKQFQREYNNTPHSSLKYLTPNQVYKDRQKKES